MRDHKTFVTDGRLQYGGLFKAEAQLILGQAQHNTKIFFCSSPTLAVNAYPSTSSISSSSEVERSYVGMINNDLNKWA